MKIRYIEDKQISCNRKIKLKPREYVSDTQSIVAPTTPQISKSEIAEGEIQVNRVTVKTIEDKISNIKNKDAKNLVELAISKGLIDEDDRDLQIQGILSMDDSEFQRYQKEVIEYQIGGEVTSEGDSKGLSEAELALRRIKSNGGQPIIGDFSDSFGSDSGDGKRNLSALRDNKITMANVYETRIPNFESDFENILSQKLAESQKPAEQQEIPTYKNKNEAQTFNGLQGLKKPIQIPSKVATLSDLFNDLNWTTISK